MAGKTDPSTGMVVNIADLKVWIQQVGSLAVGEFVSVVVGERGGVVWCGVVWCGVVVV